MKKIFTKSVCMALLVFFAWSLNAQDLTMKAALQGKSQVVQQMPQVPLDATLYSEPGGGYRGPGDVALSYGFDDCTPVTFTNGWTANPSPTGT
ncbi:MAG: hypothetical protein LBU83_09165, partial [Bacteroidales bacterium]|nr:hypothetical protein [Bacteroidales bacterium]